MKPFPLQFVSKYYNIVYQLQNGFGKKFFSKKVKENGRHRKPRYREFPRENRYLGIFNGAKFEYFDIWNHAVQEI